MSKDRKAMQRPMSAPADSSVVDVDDQTCRPVSLMHRSHKQPHLKSVDSIKDHSSSAFNQIFGFSSSKRSRLQKPNLSKRPINTFPAVSGSMLDSIEAPRIPNLDLTNDHPVHQSDLLHISTYALPAVALRHDRNALYTTRIRPDGSTSLVRLPASIASLQHHTFEATDSDSAHNNLSQEEEEERAINHAETELEFKNRLIYVFKQMMFVSGETAEPSTETTWMIEEIVRDQVIEMLKEASGLANRRGSKSISIVDLIFQIRHNPAKVSRLKTFLSWKDVRKNVKDSDDKAGGGDADALDLDEGALPGANPAAPQKTSTNKKAKLILPWEIQSYYGETVPEREDEEDEEEEEQNEATLARLASADERTKNMTREEYVYWSDCRQASFTFRKGKRFREWAGFGTIIDSKPNDDVVDILGFLTFEIVQTLTEEALKVKLAEDLANKKASGLRIDNETSKKRKREGCTLFEMPEEDRTPVEPKHVREAFRRLQLDPNKYKFMRQGYAGVRTPLRMI